METRLRFIRGGLAALLVLTLSACSSAEEEKETEQPPDLDLAVRLEPREARAGVVAKTEDLIGGLKAEGRIGDIKMYNSHAAFIIESPRPASGYRYHGGNLVDADIIRPQGEPGRDLYTETFFAWELEIFEPLSFEIVSDGRDGEAHVRFTGRTAPFAFADDFIRAIIDPPRRNLEVSYEYRLGPDDEALQLRITVTNPSDEWFRIDYPLLLASHGDGAHLFAPPGGFRGAGTGATPYIAIAGRDLAYGILAAEDNLATLFEYDDVVLFTIEPFDLFPEQSWFFDYYFVVTDRSVAGVQEARRRLIQEEATGTLKGIVELPSTTDASKAWIAVTAGDDAVTLAPIDEDGSFIVEIPEGSYQAHAYAHSHAPGTPAQAAVVSGDTSSVALSIEEGARITSSVSTPDGAPVKSRVTFFRRGDTPSPFAPAPVRHGDVWTGGVSKAAYVLGEPETIVLPAGEYRAAATRGPTWEMDETTVEVAAGENVSLSFVIEEAVDTTGWVSSDMHLHAYLSPDSDVPFETRVKQAATDALDIPLLTEHIWAGSLQETAEALGLTEDVIGIAGQEVTTFRYGHFNVFPLVVDPDLPNNGSVFEHGRTPPELFADMRDQHPGDTIIMINHPRGANPGSYFSYIGLDATEDTVGREEDWTLDWELIEVFNNSCGGSRSRETLEDWIGMTNHGHRKGISGTSDSHTERRIPGIPRNWTQVDRDELRADHQRIVAPMRERRSFVSCGPFVRFEAEDGTGMGGMTGVDAEGKVRFNVKVEAPTWMRVNEVRLLKNGETLHSFDVRDRNGEIVRFDDIVEVEPASDAWFIVEAIGSGSLAPVSWSGPPYAITNPIEVDVDGDGEWTAPALQ